MQGYFRDFLLLFNVGLPPSFCRKRIIFNFFKLYMYTLFSQMLGKGKERYKPLENVVDIESDIWRDLSSIISLYTKYLSPKYIMDTYVIRGVATSWHSEAYINHIKEHFTQDNIDSIPSYLTQKVDEVASALTQTFTGLDYSVVRHWLLTYQYGLSELCDDKEELCEKLKNTILIEIGPGTGANAAVHASISKKGVYLYDIPPMLEIQRIVMEEMKDKVDMSKVSYFHDPEDLMNAAKGQSYVVVSYWAFSEISRGLRDKLEPLLQGAEFSFFACNSQFEEIQNLTYFQDLQTRLEDKTLETQPIHWQKYKGHNYMMLK